VSDERFPLYDCLAFFSIWTINLLKMEASDWVKNKAGEEEILGTQKGSQSDCV
jgi:hypothetical protein